MIREYRRTGQDAQWDFQEVAEYLTGKGFVIGPAGVGTALDPADPGTVLVRADLDANLPQAAIDAALDAYVASANPAHEVPVELRKALKAVKGLDSSSTTPQALAALKRAVLALGAAQGVG